MGSRLTEIDALRGLAIVSMVLFHAAFDGMILGLWIFEPYGWPLILFVRAAQFLFLGLVGVSVALSSRGAVQQIWRGAFIFGCGLLVSGATWVLFPQEYVRFGVLHFIGVSVPLVALLKKRPAAALALAMLSFGAGQMLDDIVLQGEWWLWLGLKPEGFTTLDYFPLFPWLAAPLVGLTLGEYFYGKKREPRFPFLARRTALAALGRHSLAIYLLHQPILYFTLWGLSEALQ